MRGERSVQVAAAAVIEGADGKLLFMKRGMKARNQQGRWEFPGGRVHFGERLEEAVRREVEEELGVEVKVHRLLALFEDILLPEAQHWIAPAYLCSITSGIPMLREEDKAEAVGWFDADKIPGVLTEVAARTLQEYLRQKQFVS